MKLFFLFCLVFVVIFNFGCKKADGIPTQHTLATGSIQGKVIDEVSGNGIPNVSIQTSPASSLVSTNATGDFTISEVAIGAYTLTAIKYGYTGYPVNVYVMAGKTIKADISLKDTTAQVPEIPLLRAPEDNAIEVSLPAVFTWNTSAGAISYTLQLSTSYTFGSFVYNRSRITGTSQPVSGLSNSTKYYWRVSATNSSGTSAFSAVYYFNTESASCPGVTTVTYSGKVYHTVQVGTQCWLKENLDVGTRIAGSTNQDPLNGTIEKYCYDNLEANCEIYGGLYQWSEAMKNSVVVGTKGICPPGWHIPALIELQALSAITNGNGNALKAIKQGSGQNGQGTNTSGFSAMLAGYRYSDGTFYSINGYAKFWSSSRNSSYGSYYMGMFLSDSHIVYDYFGSEGCGYSIRCVKD